MVEFLGLQSVKEPILTNPCSLKPMSSVIIQIASIAVSYTIECA